MVGLERGLALCPTENRNGLAEKAIPSTLDKIATCTIGIRGPPTFSRMRGKSTWKDGLGVSRNLPQAAKGGLCYR